jgi:cytochrome c553
MIRALAFCLGGLMLAGMASAQEMAKGDPDAGRRIAGQCRTCHGSDGYAQIPIAPHIGGEPASYLIAQLQAFRDGSREHEMMTIVARGLSDESIADVAAWYAQHRAVATLAADPADAPSMCAGCHGDDGIAVIEDVPNLAGETNIYIANQLNAFRYGKRYHDIMTPISGDLSDEDIRAMADWYAAVNLEIKPLE